MTTAAELAADPFGDIWRAPDGRRLAAREMPSFVPEWELPRLGVGCLLTDDGPDAMDDRLLTAVERLGRDVWR